MRKILICVYLVMLICGLAAADQVTLNYSQCMNFTSFNETDNSTSNFTICAPAYPSAVILNLTYGECNTTNNFTACAPSYPSHVDLYLNFSQNASANNVTCFGPAANACSPPPATTLNLSWGQTSTANNVTASCKAWDNSLCVNTSTCSPPPAVTYHLYDGQNITLNNFTATCSSLGSQACLEPYHNYTLNYGQTISQNNVSATCRAWDAANCPVLTYNRTSAVLNPGDTYTNTKFNLYVRCLAQSNSGLSGINAHYDIDCSSNRSMNFADQNLSFTIYQCQDGNATQFYSPEDINSCAVKIQLCGSDLASTDCGISDLTSGRAAQCLNETMSNRQNALDVQTAKTDKCTQDLNNATSNLQGCQAGQQLNSTMIIVGGIVMLVFSVAAVLIRTYGSGRKKPR